MRTKLRHAQVLVALLVALVSAIPDLRGVTGFRSEIALLESVEKQEAKESVAPQPRAFEDVEEFAGKDPPGARIRGFVLALAGEKTAHEDALWRPPSKRVGFAHPPTGPPAA